MSTILTSLVNCRYFIEQINEELPELIDWPIEMKLPIRIEIHGSKEYELFTLEPTNFEIIDFILRRYATDENRFDAPLERKSLLKTLYKIALYRCPDASESELQGWVKMALNAFNSYNLYAIGRVHDIYLGEFKDENAYRRRRRKQKHPKRCTYKKAAPKFSNVNR